MRILVVHNHYRQPGGEDFVVRREVALLTGAGHEVREYREDNARVMEIPRIRLALKTIWSRESYRRLLDISRAFRPDVVHLHNTLPLVSPSGYYAARAGGAAVVQTLHNYRLICPGGLLLRNGRPCEDCVAHAVPWPAVRHACYRESKAASATVASMLAVHRAMGTWRRMVNAYIALTNFARDKVIAGGLPPDRVHVKPNFVEAPRHLAAPAGATGFLFVGRLSVEKGAAVLLEAWRLMGSSAPPLQVVGDGPEFTALRERARDLPSVELLGPCSPTRVHELMAGAAALLVPSLWYEAFPLVAVEALATGLPVVASADGSLATMVHDGHSGLHVPRADAAAWADAVRRLTADSTLRARLGRGARAAWETHYTPEANIRRLHDIYQSALRCARS